MNVLEVLPVAGVRPLRRLPRVCIIRIGNKEPTNVSMMATNQHTCPMTKLDTCILPLNHAVNRITSGLSTTAWVLKGWPILGPQSGIWIGQQGIMEPVCKTAPLGMEDHAEDMPSRGMNYIVASLTVVQLQNPGMVIVCQLNFMSSH